MYGLQTYILTDSRMSRQSVSVHSFSWQLDHRTDSSAAAVPHSTLSVKKRERISKCVS